jgi:hypothetical protein
MNNLATILKDVNGASFISIDTETEPYLKGGKKNPYQNRVKKIMTGSSVMVFQNKTKSSYEDMVKRRLHSEGKNPDTFVLQPRKWGERIPHTPFIQHEKDGKTKYYLEVIFLKPGKVHYEVDGVKTDPTTIDGLDLNKEEAAQGGLDDKVIIRTFSVDSITGLRAFGKTYGNFSVEFE